jgi:hypothetical protein
LTRWLIERLLPAAWRDSVEGDLVEDQAHRRGAGRSAGLFWQAATVLTVAARLRLDRLEWPSARPLVTGAIFDCRLASLRLLRAPRFLILTSCCLAVAIVVGGGVTAVGALLLPSNGARDADRLYPVLRGGVRVSPTMSVSDFRSLESSDAVAGRFAASLQVPAAVASPWGRGVERLEAVSGAYFETRRLHSRAGRLLSVDDDAASRQVVVLSEQFWRARTTESDDVIGRELSIAGHPFVVVGVAEWAAASSDGMVRSWAWIPLSTATSLRPAGGERDLDLVDVTLRAADGVLTPQLSAQVSRAGERLDAEVPLGPHERRQWSISRSLEDFSAAPSSMPVAIIGALAALFVVVTACITVANLTLARAAGRSGERYVRDFLGAGWNRLLAPDIAESFIAMTLGGGLGWLLLSSVLRSVSLVVPLYEFANVSVSIASTRVAVIATIVATLAAVVIAVLWPAVLSARGHARNFFNVASPVSLRSADIQARLIAWQTGATVALSLLALMCLRTLAEPSHIRGWQHVDNSAVALVSFAQNGVPTEASLGMTSRVAEALTRPHLRAAAFSTLPVDTAAKRTISDPGTHAQIRAAVIGMSASAPDVVGLHLLGGTWPSKESDSMSQEAVISRRIAEALFHNLGNALGRDIEVDGHRYAVLGICDSVAGGFGPELAAYVPLRAVYAGRAAIVVSGPSATYALAAIRDELRHSWPSLVVGVTGTAREVVGRSFYLPRLIAHVVTLLSVTTLILALVGLHGVCSQSVTSRLPEIGVRMACGATRTDVAHRVVVSGLFPIVKGILAGTAFAWLVPAVTLAMTSVQLDTPGFATSVALGLATIAIAAVACAGPAYRASRADPCALLRQT